MTVKVVTDSTADLPPSLTQGLGITVVPLTVHFGKEAFQDGVDLSTEEFYRRLVRSKALPKTAAPSAGLFTEAYAKLAAQCHGIISIHISAKLSGTYDAALLGRKSVNFPIEVVDSLSTSMGVGLLAVMAAKAAQAGADLAQIKEMVLQAVPRAHLLGMVDTLEYLLKGGRIGKAEAFMGARLNIKPLLTVRQGETFPLERVRTRPKAVEELCKLAKELSPAQEMAVLHNTTPEDGEKLAEILSPVFPKDKIYRARFGPVMGTHIGPGALGIALIQQEKIGQAGAEPLGK